MGEPNSVAPYLQVEIYRPGSEIAPLRRSASRDRRGGGRARAGRVATRGGAAGEQIRPAVGRAFDTSKGAPRHCLGFVRAYDDPRLQLSGWFCRGGDRSGSSTLACALDRLTLLSAGSEPKVGALFAQAELNRSYCGQHDPILAATPKYKLLWKALATRPEPRRIGR